MNEMRELGELGSTLDPEGATPPEALRRRVMAHVVEGGRSPGRSRRWSGRAGVRRSVWGGRPSARSLGLKAALAGLLGAVLTVGFVVTGSVPSEPPPSGGSVPGVDPKAVRILHNAAQTVAKNPVVPPRPNQFVYVESITAYGGTVEVDGVDRRLPPVRTRRQVWLPVDLTRDGLVREQPLSGKEPASENVLAGCGDCYEFPPYLGEAPADPDKILAYLYSVSHRGTPKLDSRGFATVRDSIRETYLPPAAYGAVLEATARIPGISVEPGVVDGAGRPGIAVGLADGADRVDLIFDPHTYEFLGERYIFSGKVEYPNTRLRIAIVDRAGQLP